MKILLNTWTVRLLATIVLCALAAPADDLLAQAQRVWLNVGDFQHKLAATGAEPEVMRWEGVEYPGIPQNDQPQAHVNRKSLWIGTESHMDENGEVWSPRVVHTGPRDYHLEQFYPKPMQLISRLEAPEVSVDGIASFDKVVFIDEVDPSLNADRMVIRDSNTLLGVRVYNEVRAFSQEFHDDYLIYDYTLTNTGNMDEDEDIEFPDQTLEGVMIYFETKYQYRPNLAGPGTNTMTDIMGDGMEEYDVPFRGHYSWHGAVPWSPSGARDGVSSLGCPAWADDHNTLVAGDSLGRLTCTEFVTRTTLYAGKGSSLDADDPTQPSVLGVIRGGDPITNNNSAHDQLKMTDEYAYMHPDIAYADYGAGTQYPHHADIVAPPEGHATWYDQMAAQRDIPNRGHTGGWIPTMAYGPYTLAPGESIRIVYVEGFAGLSNRANVDIGRAYKLSRGDESELIPFDANGDDEIDPDTELRTKSHWVLTGRDSVFQMLERATANFESGYDLPQAPNPPSSFAVTSGTDRIILEWEPFGSDSPPGGYEIYRSRNRYQGAVEDGFEYELIATLGPDARSYDDTSVQRGISYYYYIQAVGDVNNDPTGLTPTGVPLKSGRHYTQTFDPAFLRRAPGSGLEAARIVPNPYNLSSAKEVRWPDQQDRIGFLEIPGNCTISIYTETGELIRKIEHTNGSGDEYWNLTTSSNQLVVSGIYFAVIRDNETGDQIYRNFAIIR